MSYHVLLSILLLGVSFLGRISEKDPMTLQSPDSTLKVTVWKGQTGYKFKAGYSGFEFLKEAELGMKIKEMPDIFSSASRVKGPFFQKRTFNVTGVHDSAHVSWNDYTVEFNNGEAIEFRLFDHAVAYRYRIDADTQTFRDMGERSSWMLPDSTKVWYFERNNDWKLKSYAGEWVSTDISHLNTVSSMGPVQGKPLVFEFQNGKKGFLSEAALYDYSGLRFKALDQNKVKADFTEGKKGFKVTGPLKTPWRVAYIADDLNTIVNQDVLLALNPAPDPELFQDNEWIKPGRSVWRFWSNDTGNPQQEMKMVVDASDLGFEYILIDEGWEDWPNKWDQLHRMVSYADRKKVGVWVWKHSGQLNFPEHQYRVLRDFLDSVKVAGVSGIKVDFMNGETKSLIDFDIAVLREAAKRKLMVDFHGCQAPSGEMRTYPNELTREGIRGMELNTMSEGPITASHNAALPFTRFVVGHADYTPLVFSSPGSTSWAHQLATLVVFTSPLQVIAENPNTLLDNPALKEALPFLRVVPTVWDQTRVLPGSEIGELAAFARKSGKNWFVGILNGGREKTYTLDLSTLGIRNNRAVLYHDTSHKISNPISRKSYQKSQLYARKIIPFKTDTVNISNRKLTVNLAKHGGAVLWIKENHY